MMCGGKGASGGRPNMSLCCNLMGTIMGGPEVGPHPLMTRAGSSILTLMIQGWENTLHVSSGFVVKGRDTRTHAPLLLLPPHTQTLVL